MKYLRPLQHEEIYWLAEVRNRPEYKKWFRQPHLLTNEDQETWFKGRDGHHFIIRQEGEEVPYGYCYLRGIHPVHRDAEFGLFTFPMGKHPMATVRAFKELLNYGFSDLGLHRIHSDVIEGNPALEFFKRMGFSEEGVNKDIYWKEGKWVSSTNIAMLRGT